MKLMKNILLLPFAVLLLAIGRRGAALLLAVVVAVGALSAFADVKAESHFSELWCDSVGGESSKRPSDGTVADCLTADSAVEFDFGKGMKPYECTGRALHYAELTGRRPLCVLIARADISDAQFDRAVQKASTAVEVRCMNDDGEMFDCPTVQVADARIGHDAVIYPGITDKELTKIRVSIQRYNVNNTVKYKPTCWTIISVRKFRRGGGYVVYCDSYSNRFDIFSDSDGKLKVYSGLN